MNNLTHRQIIFIGIAGLFGIPVCIGFAIGYFAGFWAGVIVAVLAIAIIASIAMRWRQRQSGSKGEDNENRD